MCKIAVFTNSSKLNAKAAAESIGQIMLGIEKDGFGYAIQGQKSVFGEKTTASKFKSRIGIDTQVKLPIVQIRHSTFGVNQKPIGPAIFHGRTSTNDKGLLNCHPMTKDNWNLIHNGVVYDQGPKYDKATTNDSEDLLHRLILGIGEVETQLTGYYAFAAIDPKGLLHIGRDSIATLYIAWCPKIESYLIATTESLLESIAEKMKIKIGPVDKIQDNIYMIFNGNEIISQKTINPRGYDSRQADLAELSLGRKLDSGNSFDSKLIDMTSDYRFNDSSNYIESEDREYIEDMMTEMDSLDDTYEIWDYMGRPISADEYYAMDEISKAECRIIRADGTIVDTDIVYDQKYRA